MLFKNRMSFLVRFALILTLLVGALGVRDVQAAPLGAGGTTTVLVTSSGGMPLAGKPVYAFDGSTYTGYSKVTDANGEAALTLPEGIYRFRVDVDGTQFWSGPENHCSNCLNVAMTIPDPVLVTVQGTDGAPATGLNVYAFNDATYSSFHGITDQNGQISLRLPEGAYRFRADLNGTQFWSGTANHCNVPGCDSASVTVSQPMTVTVLDTEGLPISGLNVYAFNGSTYTGYNKTTNADGQAVFTLPLGSYRFRADLNGTQFWSGTANHCDIPGCSNVDVTVSKPVTVTVFDAEGLPLSGLSVYAFNGSTYTGYSKTANADGQAIFTLPLGSYRFRADRNGTQFWSETSNHCEIPGCESASVNVTNPMTVTVLDTEGTPQIRLNVYAFNGTTYTGYSKVTDAAGQAVFTLPLGSYRFRADLNGTQFWSDVSNHCEIPHCESAQVTVTQPVTVMIVDGNRAPQSGVKVYAFHGSTYTGYSKVSDDYGDAIFTLPMGSYRFRADYNGAQYWSDSSNHCDIPGCLITGVIVGPVVTPTFMPTPAATPTSTPPLPPIVTNTNDSGPGSLRQVIADASPATTITFDPTLAGQTIVLASQLDIDKNLTIDGSGLSPRISISGNHAVRILEIGPNNTVTLRSLILRDGMMSGTSYTAYGGALYADRGNLTITNVAFIGNTAYEAGAIYISPYANVTISGSEFTSNSASTSGGAIYVQSLGSLTLRDSLIQNNQASGSGGAIDLEAAGIRLLENNTFSGNSAGTAGAVMINQTSNSDVTLRNNLFRENISTSSVNGGGALRIRMSSIPAVLKIEGNTFYANQAANVGGAVWSDGGTANFKNNTFSNNQANKSGGNGGASLYLTPGGGIYLYNNILANNAGGGECSALASPYVTGNNNLIEDGSGPCATLPGTIVSDPILAALADNGGSTQTMALGTGSPAIDAGDDANCPATDPRGVTRPQGAHCDIGAYEANAIVTPTYTPTFTPTPAPVPTTRVVTNASDSGEGSLRQVVLESTPGDRITFAPALAGQTITLASDLTITKDLMIDGSGLSAQVTISGGNVAHLQINGNPVVTIFGLTIVNGYTSGSGGAISSTGDLTIINSTLRNNHADGDGGAVDISYGTLTLENTTVDHNQAGSNGGAFAFEGTAHVDIVNSTVAQNHAGVRGGAILMAGSAQVSIYNSTFAMNSAPNTSTAWVDGLASLYLYNAIFVCDPENSVCLYRRALAEVHYVNSIVGSGPSSEYGLAELADNGGPTQTMALLPGSSLIDAGDDTVCVSIHGVNRDQRGVIRPQGAHCDIGAYEYETTAILTTTTLVTSPNPSEPGQTAVATATVNSSLGTPTGTLDFSVDGNVICTRTLTNGTASCDLVLNENKTVVAIYHPADSSFISSSGSVLHEVGLSSTIVTVLDSPDPSIPGNSVNILVSVTNTYDGAVPTGTVRVSTSSGNCAIMLDAGQGSCSVIFNTLGMSTITAEYSGDFVHLPSSGTASHEVLASVPAPTFTPTPGPTPVLGCSSISNGAGAISFSGRTMFLNIPNPNPYPVTVRSVFVAWNYSAGHTAGNTSLWLQKADLNGAVFWTGNLNQPTALLPLSTTVVIPANMTAKLTFTFDKVYDRRSGMEQIQIQFSTPGCENYPVIRPAGAPTITLVP